MILTKEICSKTVILMKTKLPLTKAMLLMVLNAMFVCLPHKDDIAEVSNNKSVSDHGEEGGNCQRQRKQRQQQPKLMWQTATDTLPNDFFFTKLLPSMYF